MRCMEQRPLTQRSRNGWAASIQAGLAVCVAVALGACAAGLPSTAAGSPRSTGGDDAVSDGAVTEQVTASIETEPVPHSGDAADDPAVWVNPVDPSMSAVVATDKQGGLLVYDLAGKELQYLPAGEMNNVDVRPAADGFTVGGRPVVLVVSGNRSDNTIGVFVLDPDTRQLRDVATAPIEPGLEVYGSCVYRSPTGAFYAFVNSKGGDIEQWQLSDDGSGMVTGKLVRSFGLGSQTEGCVADDELGHLYLGEEAEGIWKFSAEPDGGDTGTLIATVSSSGPLVGQVEGISLAYGPNGTGHLIASSQGDSSFAVFRREGENGYVGSFRIVAGGGIDGTDDTDGIDVATGSLGPAFPSGVLVAQDGKNDGTAQNFKLVPLQNILPS